MVISMRGLPASMPASQAPALSGSRTATSVTELASIIRSLHKLYDEAEAGFGETVVIHHQQGIFEMHVADNLGGLAVAEREILKAAAIKEGSIRHSLAEVDLRRSRLAIDVTIRDIAPTPVTIMEHRGDPETIGATIQRFIAWQKATGLSPKSSQTFNVFHSDPRTTPPAECRKDLCVGTDRSIEACGERIEAGVIPGGRCAVLRVVGNTDNLDPAALL